MKELSIEEKAKAYDEALERAKKQLDGAKVFDYEDEQIAHDIRTTTYAIFPELKESEDEKVRKTLIDYFKNYKTQEDIGIKTFFGIPTDDIIAWLEKQKEFVSADFDDVWETADCNKLTAPLEKYSKDAIKEMCHAWYDKGIELERRNWLEKQSEQKPASWSDEDEQYLLVCKNALAKYQGSDKWDAAIVSSWLLNKLKCPVFQQPKQEWSEEDEKMYDSVLWHLRYSVNNGDTEHSAGQIECWLKSLKDRYTWKPSEEQMELLHDAAKRYEGLESLYNDLKKLKD